MHACGDKKNSIAESIYDVKGFPDIKGFQETTLLDWEGKIASIIFLGGCNFRCGFCHSRGLVLSPEKLDSVSFDDIDIFLRSKTGWIDGVVITGGEPTLYKSELINLIRAVKDRGFSVKLDTNGTNPKLLEKLLDNALIDYIAMDVKAPFERESYREITGVDTDIKSIIMSKDIVIGSKIDYEFRTTIVPDAVSVCSIEEIAKSLVPAKRYRLQQFQPKDTLDMAFLDKKPCAEEDLVCMVHAAKKYIPDTKFRE